MKKIDRAYATYKKKHKELVSKRPDMYGQKYTKAEFKEKYEEARLKGLKNPARTVALNQREWTYNFERSYFKKTGYKVTGKELTEKQLKELTTMTTGATIIETELVLENEESRETTLTREAVFENYYLQRKNEDPNLSHDAIEAEFKAMY